jgi:hypothetical protein
LVFLFLVSRESGSGVCCDTHLVKHGASFLWKFLGQDVVAEAPRLDPREMPQMRYSPADDPGELADLLGEAARSVGQNNKASNVDSWHTA